MFPLSAAFDAIRFVTSHDQLFAMAIAAIVAAMFLFAGLAIALVKVLARVLPRSPS